MRARTSARLEGAEGLRDRSDVDTDHLVITKMDASTVS
jgi:hypothetical protein